VSPVTNFSVSVIENLTVFEPSATPTLAWDDYIAFLDSIPFHPSTFYYAVAEGTLSEVNKILSNHRLTNVNWKDPLSGRTALHHACDKGYTYVVAVLLRHEGIEYGPDKTRSTPLHLACRHGHSGCVRLVLGVFTSYFHFTRDDQDNYPLTYAIRYGHSDTVKWWIALSWGPPYRINPIRTLEDRKFIELCSLVEGWMTESGRVEKEVERELCVADLGAFKLFAMIVFLCDELLAIKRIDTDRGRKAARFFDIVSQLPLELQVVVCFRRIGLRKDVIHRKDSEEAFKMLVIELAFQQN